MFAIQFLFFTACGTSKDVLHNETQLIEGRWVQRHDSFDVNAFHRGLQWQLSGIGLLQSDWNVILLPMDEPFHWWVNLEIQKNENSCLDAVIAELDASEPFVSQLAQLTLNPIHVAKITQQPEQLSDWLNQFTLDSEIYLEESLIVESPRIIQFRESTANISQVAYLAFEHDMPDFVETIDVMSNGRLRYGQYQFGDFVGSTELGSVARCQWCHEAKLLDLQAQEDVQGYVPYAIFSQAVSTQNQMVVDEHDSNYPNGLLLDGENHEYGEQLFEAYLYPTTVGLSREWNQSTDFVQDWLIENGLVGTEHSEYPEWGSVYLRDEIVHALGGALSMPMSPREWPLNEWPTLPIDSSCNSTN